MLDVKLELRTLLCNVTVTMTSKCRNHMDKVATKQLAQLIKTERLNKGFTQQELSAETGISLRSIQRIENAEVYPRSFTLKLIAEKLELSFEELYLKNANRLETKTRTNKSQKILMSITVALVFFLLTCAFIFQSPTFPESTFELAMLLAMEIAIYGLVLFRIWK